MNGLLLVAFLAQTAATGPEARPQTQAVAPGRDVVKLLNGDRVTGRVIGGTTRRVRVQTAYGSLVIPHDRVLLIERDGGVVEVLNAPPAAPVPVPPPPPEPTRLNIAVSGDTYWQAWDPKTAPEDASLRLELRLDDAELASYTDTTLDPEDLPKTVVNSFVFSPEKLTVLTGEGVVAAPVLVAGGEIGLALKVPGEWAGPHHLRLAYQVNEGPRTAPRWRDVVTTETKVRLPPGGTVRLRVEQRRGTMEYAGRRMRNRESFTVAIRDDEEGPPVTTPTPSARPPLSPSASP